MDAVYAMMADRTLELEVAASYELEDFAEAIKHAGNSRFGKVLLKP
jgi:NADPH:quinone reductase-like Zn-dependent oxidoreductase